LEQDGFARGFFGSGEHAAHHDGVRTRSNGFCARCTR
jgi:hypothetical protein